MSFRALCLVSGGIAMVGSSGCGWSNRQTRNNTSTGVSESGYPGGQAADPGSPALESMRREEKKGVTEHSPKGEAGRPGATMEETKAPGRDKSGEKK